MASILVHCLLAVCLVSAVMADCYHDRLHYQRNSNGRMENFCLTSEVKPRKIFVGQTAYTDDCYECACSHQGLRCCGFGIKAGKNAQRVPGPPGCMLVVDGCSYYFLDPITQQHC